MHKKLAFLLISISLLASCQWLPTKKTPPSANDPLEHATTQNQAVEKAIKLLEHGDFHAASSHLKQVLNVNRNHSTAQLLWDQLTQTPQQLFNTARLTNYKIKPGDSLGKIAESWLGNSLYFVTLAKINKITNPMKLMPGQLIQVPVTPTSKLYQQEQLRAKANINLLKKYLAQSNYYKGLEKANRLFITEQHHAELYKIQQQLMQAMAQKAVSLSERSKMLEKLSQLAQSSRNTEQQKIYRHFIENHTIALYTDEFVLLVNDESYLEAAEKLIQIKALKSPASLSQSGYMESQLLDKLHEQAVVFYRNHKLKEAMTRWNLILQIQPNNELAQKYTQRSQKLLKKLNQF
ncbi:LysM peptidoglycan-binding domain-containing protein [Aliikangiella maris]|uniref:LysM domain-containing protein n=2 Tax=Aliikangiella maris TaxID=3162458 RepID=A0ABV3MQ25_9GAMM